MPSEALTQNLGSSASELSRLSARRRFYLADAASLAARAVKDGRELPVPPKGLTEGELAEYAEMLYDALGGTVGTTLTYHEGGARIAYLRQGYADAAYTLFADGLDGATVLYTETGRGAAEAVFSEAADFCILPFSDRDGCFVRSTRAITEEMGLVLTGTASVGAGETGTLTYALYGRAPLPPAAELLSLTLRLPFTSDGVLSLLSAAVRAREAELTALEGAKSGALLRVGIRVRRAELDRLLFTLQTILSDTDVVGLAPFSEE